MRERCMRRGSPSQAASLASTTIDEQRLWYHLRTRQLRGAKFRRQMPIGPYFVDFCCIEAKLIVELDSWERLQASLTAELAQSQRATRSRTVRSIKPS